MYFSVYSANPRFTWMINKHPDTQYERKLGKKFHIHGGYVNDREFKFNLTSNKEHFISYARRNNLPFYLVKEEYMVSPITTIAIDNVFKETLRSKFSNDIVDDPYPVEIRVGPIIIDEELLNDLFLDHFVIGLEYECTDMGIEHRPVGELVLKGTLPLATALQMAYVLLTAYSSKFCKRDFVPPKSQLEKIYNLSKDWLGDHDAFNFIARKLAVSRSNANLLKGKHGKEVRYFDIEASLGYKRMDAMISCMGDEERILDLGCGNGALLMQLLRERKFIKRYMGIDRDIMKMKRCRQKFCQKTTKFKFFASDIRNPDPWFYELTTFVSVVEVLEHIDDVNRKKLIDFLVANCYNKRVFITVPNFEVNFPYWHLSGYRHRDHKTEYCYHEFMEEIWKPFADSDIPYNMETVMVEDDFWCFQDQKSYAVCITGKGYVDAIQNREEQIDQGSGEDSSTTGS